MGGFLSLRMILSLIFPMDHFITNFKLNPEPWLIYISGKQVNFP